MDTFIANTLDLFLEAAPWLLFGLLLAGLIKTLIPEALIQRWLAGNSLYSPVRAALIGAPLPLCSCGVIPTALTLRRGGASKGSTVSFLIATPETGADSIALSYAMLGPWWAVIRPLGAIASAIVSGLLTGWMTRNEQPAVQANEAPTSACGCQSGCCGTADAAPVEKTNKVVAGLHYAIHEIIPDVMPWLMGGLLLAGVITTLIPPMTLAEWGSGLPAMLLMVLVGIPIYVCATASTPLAAAMLLAGVSPGTVLVFLLAGPATNLATLGVVRHELGNRATVAYLLGITTSAIGLGLLLDEFAQQALQLQADARATSELLPAWLEGGSVALLLLLWAWTLLKKPGGNR